jgi:hypothetical protein
MTQHSVKPRAAYEHIEVIFPERRKIELFAVPTGLAGATRLALISLRRK